MTLLLAAQRRAVRQWIADGLAAAGKPIPLDRIAPTPQDAVKLTRPYVEVDVTGSTKLGPAPERRSYGDHGAATHTNYQPATTTVSISIVGAVDIASLDDDPGEYVAQLEPQLWAPDVAEVLRAANLSVNAVITPGRVDRLTGQSQWERRAVMDVVFNHTTLATSQPGTVAQTEITGTTEPPTPIGNFTVGAP